MLFKIELSLSSNSYCRAKVAAFKSYSIASCISELINLRSLSIVYKSNSESGFCSIPDNPGIECVFSSSFPLQSSLCYKERRALLVKKYMIS